MIHRPELNPIRLTKVGNYDYKSKFPTLDNLLSSQSLVNVLSVPVHQKWSVGVELVFQIWSSNTVTVYAYLNGVETELTPEYVTPIGFVSNFSNVLSYSFTPTEEGCLYFSATETDFIVNYSYLSDKIDVETEPKDQILIEYQDETNKKGFVFNNNQGYNPTLRVYLPGKLSVIGKSDVSTYVDSLGNLNKLSQITRKGRRLEFFKLQETMYTKLNMILSCSNLTVNGVSYQSEGEFDIEPNGNSNAINCSVELFMTNWNFGLDDNYQSDAMDNVCVDGVGDIFTDGNNEAFTI